MFSNLNIIDLINIFNKNNVQYILIGGYAVMHYTEPRYTKDVDLLINSSIENAKKVISSLDEFGIPKEQLNIEMFSIKEKFFKFGKPPWRIDLITSIKGCSFDKIYKNSTIEDFEDFKIKIISKNDLKILKQIAGRDQDLLDLKLLNK